MPSDGRQSPRFKPGSPRSRRGGSISSEVEDNSSRSTSVSTTTSVVSDRRSSAFRPADVPDVPEPPVILDMEHSRASPSIVIHPDPERPGHEGGDSEEPRTPVPPGANAPSEDNGSSSNSVSPRSQSRNVSPAPESSENKAIVKPSPGGDQDDQTKSEREERKRQGKRREPCRGCVDRNVVGLMKRMVGMIPTAAPKLTIRVCDTGNRCQLIIVASLPKRHTRASTWPIESRLFSSPFMNELTLPLRGRCL